MKTACGDEIDVARGWEWSDQDQAKRILDTIGLDVSEGGRGPNDREGAAIVYVTPTEARQLAAELTRLADEIEGKEATDGNAD
jgi:hypothetical protein